MTLQTPSPFQRPSNAFKRQTAFAASRAQTPSNALQTRNLHTRLQTPYIRQPFRVQTPFKPLSTHPHTPLACERAFRARPIPDPLGDSRGPPSRARRR